jgi:hypothetical protein
MVLSAQFRCGLLETIRIAWILSLETVRSILYQAVVSSLRGEVLRQTPGFSLRQNQVALAVGLVPCR